MLDHNEILKRLPLRAMLGEPVRACIEAQASAAQSSRRYLEEVALARNGEGDLNAVTVSFSYQNEGKRLLLTLPLMTIIPIPIFTIDTLDIAFDAEVTGYDNHELQCSYTRPYEKGEKKASVQTSRESHLQIRLHASQNNVPLGISKLLSLLDQTIDLREPINPTSYAKVNLLLSDKEITLPIGASHQLYALELLVDDEGVWSSSDPHIVSVNENGVATALGDGIVDICFETEGGIGFCTIHSGKGKPKGEKGSGSMGKGYGIGHIPIYSTQPTAPTSGGKTSGSMGRGYGIGRIQSTKQNSYRGGASGSLGRGYGVERIRLGTTLKQRNFFDSTSITKAEKQPYSQPIKKTDISLKRERSRKRKLE